MNTITATPGVSSSRVSAPLSFKVSNQLRVNADQTLKLADTYIIAQGRPPLNPPLASNASFQTVVQGGRPPYKFLSNKPEFAVVDEFTGKVVATGVGTATITVSDSSTPRNTASYEIKFTGTARLVKQGPQVSWSPNVGDLNRPDKHALTLNQLKLLWEQYETELNGGSLLQHLGFVNVNRYWSGTNNLSDATAFAIDLTASRPNFNGFLLSGGTVLHTLSRVGTW